MPRTIVTEGSSMTNLRLAEAFLERARARLRALDTLREEADFSDVIREARDIVELCFRGMLRITGVEVSRWRDPGEVLRENMPLLPAEVRVHADRISEIYEDLRRHRPIDVSEDGMPPEKVMMVDADRATAEAEWILGMAQLTVDQVSHRRTPAQPGR
ncbi:MAG TPA: HEPN domain-containing protein [Candidatus Polarisedimenticolia bacterium]|nr:HEPN domain-containing protein [Candidatus Polarisedimenticolia bacterium]